MPNFRETNWFKRGELVVDEEVDGAVDLPIEDRYVDTGSTSNSDTALYGVHTGETSRIPSVKILFDQAPDTMHPDPTFASSVVGVDPSSARDLKCMIIELKQRNRTIVAMCGAALVALVAFAAVLV
jgi:hypothetical protein